MLAFLQCVPIPWQNINLQDEGRKLKWGVIWEDGMSLLSYFLLFALCFFQEQFPPVQHVNAHYQM